MFQVCCPKNKIFGGKGETDDYKGFNDNAKYPTPDTCADFDPDSTCEPKSRCGKKGTNEDNYNL